MDKSLLKSIISRAKHRKRVLFCFAIIGLCLLQTSGWDNKRNNQDFFRLTAKAAEKVVRTGDPIVIRLTLTNISKDVHPLLVYANDYREEVRDKTGKMIPMTARCALNFGVAPSGIGIMGQWADPSQIAEEDNDVANECYDLSQPGSYTIVYNRNVTAGDHKGIYAVSNPVTVKVIP